MTDVADPAGFVPLPRSLIAQWLEQLSPEHFKVAVACWSMANWRDREWFSNGQRIAIARGSFVTSAERLAQASGRGLTAKSVRNAWAKLRANGWIETGHPSGKAFTVVTIVDYDAIRDPEDGAGKGTGKGRAKDSESNRTDRATTKEVRSNKKKISMSASPPPTRGADIPGRAWDGADYFRSKVLEQQPGNIIGTKLWSGASPSRKKWANDLRKIHEIDGRPWEEIGRTINWLFDSQTSPDGRRFVVLSPESLREKWDRIQAVRDKPAPRDSGAPPTDWEDLK